MAPSTKTTIRARWRALLATAFILLTPACSRPVPIEARPAVWRVEDADTVIWLFGTIHALPPGVAWETRAVRTAIDRAEMLVTEIPSRDPVAASEAFKAAAHGTGLPPVARRLAPQRRAALLRGIDAADLTLAEADGLKTWAVAAVIGGGSARAAGARPRDGVEAVLATRFRSAGKPQRALETAAQQYALFDSLPETAQRAMLDRALAAPDGYPALLAAWRTGNIGRMAAHLDREFGTAPVLRETLITRRNARWAGWIARRMDRPGRVLVAVGAGHLVGDGSVIAMLRGKRMTVTRVE